MLFCRACSALNISCCSLFDGAVATVENGTGTKERTSMGVRSISGINNEGKDRLC